MIIRIDARDFDSDGLNNEYDHCAMGEIVESYNSGDVDQDGCKDSGTRTTDRART